MQSILRNLELATMLIDWARVLSVISFGLLGGMAGEAGKRLFRWVIKKLKK